MGIGREAASAPITAVAVAFVCALTTLISIAFTRFTGKLPALWITGGLICGILLTSPQKRWPALTIAAWLGNAAGRFASDAPWPTIAGLSLLCTIEPVAAQPAHTISVLTNAIFAMASAFVASMTLPIQRFCQAASKTAAAGLGGLHVAPFAPLWRDWFIPHALGTMIFATLVVTARAQGARLLGRDGQRLSLALSVAVAAAACVAVFAQSRYPLLFLQPLPLLFCVFRHRFAGFVHAGSAARTSRWRCCILTSIISR